MTMIQKFFDEAIRLKEGEVLTLPCDSYKQANSIRTMVYRKRNEYQKHHPIHAELLRIFINHVEVNGKKKYSVNIEHMVDSTPGFIKTKLNGEEELVQVHQDITPFIRRVKLQIQDGIPESEIKQDLKDAKLLTEQIEEILLQASETDKEQVPLWESLREEQNA